MSDEAAMGKMDAENPGGRWGDPKTSSMACIMRRNRSSPAAGWLASVGHILTGWFLTVIGAESHELIERP